MTTSENTKTLMKKIITKLTPALKGMDPRPQGCIEDLLIVIAALLAVSVLVTTALRHH